MKLTNEQIEAERVLFEEWIEPEGYPIQRGRFGYSYTYVQKAWSAWRARAEYAQSAPVAGQAFQQRVSPWLQACFGAEIAADKVERNHRFLEEALETVQAGGCTASEAHQLVDYVFGRPVGEIHQEIGGAMVTLAALSSANGVDMHSAGETELARIWTKVEQILAKQAAKPKHSPLPVAVDSLASQVKP